MKKKIWNTVGVILLVAALTVIGCGPDPDAAVPDEGKKAVLTNTDKKKEESDPVKVEVEKTVAVLQEEKADSEKGSEKSDEPETKKTGTVKENSTKKENVNPGSSKPDSSKPDGSKPGNSKPDNSKPGTSKPEKPAHTHTWKENYVTLHHDAEYENQWVVDQKAWDESVPVYTTECRSICNQCGKDITGNTTAHFKASIQDGKLNCSGYHAEYVQVQTGTDTIHHEEKGHYNKVLVKNAWDEKVQKGWICSGCGATK